MQNAGDDQLKRRVLFWLQGNIEAAISSGNSLRLRTQLDSSASSYSVQPTVGQGDGSGIQHGILPLSAPGTINAANFKNIRVVGVELQGNRNLDRAQAEIRDSHLFVASVLIEEFRTGDQQRSPRDLSITGAIDIYIGEISCEQRIVFSNRGAEQQRAGSIDEKGKLGQKAGALVEDAFFAQAGRFHVAVAVEDGKHPAVLQNPGAVILGSRLGRNVILLSASLIHRLRPHP